MYEDVLTEFRVEACIINIDFEKDTNQYIVYFLDSDNHWLYLSRYKDLKLAVYFAYKFYGCHHHFTRLSINYLSVK